MNGGPLLQVLEPSILNESRSKVLKTHFKPLVLKKFYECRWFKEKLDLSKLAKMKWIEGKSTHELARIFNLSTATVRRHLGRLKKSDSIRVLDLSKTEVDLITEN